MNAGLSQIRFGEFPLLVNVVNDESTQVNNLIDGGQRRSTVAHHQSTVRQYQQTLGNGLEINLKMEGKMSLKKTQNVFLLCFIFIFCILD